MRASHVLALIFGFSILGGTVLVSRWMYPPPKPAQAVEAPAPDRKPPTTVATAPAKQDSGGTTAEPAAR